MDPVTVGALSSVIAGLVMLLIDRKVFPKREAPPKIIYYDQRGTPVQRRLSQPAVALPRWALVTLAVCLPPLAVYWERGNHKALWINIGLTLLWFGPGVFHALFIVLGSRVEQR
ncbi:MAG: YqaE/Pmp3 family membrane protein [Cyanobacteria bacterium J06598_3]